ncbi:MAG: hypothetical protein ABI599_09260 [Flavobacteriales bacterium]
MAMKETVDRLRAFVEELKARPDVLVLSAHFADPFAAEDLAPYGMPPDIVALFGEAAGIHVKWRFREGTGGGELNIISPSYANWERYADFGEGTEGMPLDDLEGVGAFLVRPLGQEEHRVFFVPPVDDATTVKVADSIDEYLQLSMDNGFVTNWPLCFGNGGVQSGSYAEQEAIITRFKNKPAASVAVEPAASRPVNVRTVAMKEAVDRLKAFIEELKQRPDLEVINAELEPGLTDEQLAAMRDVPEELMALYAEVGGVHVKWRFREPSGNGEFRLPRARSAAWEGDRATCMNFGDETESITLDGADDSGTYFVRNVGEKDYKILFARSGNGSYAVKVADSVVEFLDLAMENGFVYYWPNCFGKEGMQNVSFAAQEAMITRFKKEAHARVSGPRS